MDENGVPDYTDMSLGKSLFLLIFTTSAVPAVTVLHFHWKCSQALQLAEEFIKENLFMIADKYITERLKSECEKQMCSVLNMDNAIKYVVAAYVHSAPKLLEASVRFLVERSKELWDVPEWKELSLNYSDLFYLICRRIVESNDMFVV